MPTLNGVVHRASMASTQDEAKRRAEAGAPARTLVRADRQTRGRGREDRRWSSGKGGLYFSLILRPKISPTKLAALSLKTGRRLARALKQFGIKTYVKPPNDIFASVKSAQSAESASPPKKLAGILIEARSSGKGIDWLVIGIGINVNNRLPSGLDACSLHSLTGRIHSLDRVLKAAIAAIS